MPVRFRVARLTVLATLLALFPASAYGAVTVAPGSIGLFPTQQSVPINVMLTFPATTFAGTGNLVIQDSTSPGSGLPAGFSLTPAAVTYTFAAGATSATTTFRVNIAAGTAPGSYSLDVRDTTLGAGAGILLVTVTTPSFTATAAPNPVTVATGSSTGVTVTTNADPGFTFDIQYSFTGFPAGITFTAGGSSTITVPPPYAPVLFTASVSGVAPGTYNGSLNAATPTAGPPRTFPMTVIVPAPDFNFAVSPPTQSVAQGGGGSLSFTVARLNGFTAPVTVSLSGAAPDITFPAGTFPLTIPAGSTTANASFTVDTGASPGTRTLSFNAAGNGLSKTDTAQVNVTAGPDFTFAVSPPTQSASPGGSGMLTFTVNRLNGFTAPVTVSLSGTAPGITFPAGTFPLTMPAGSTTANASFTVDTGASPGTRTLSFNATGGGLSKTATAQVNVTAGPDFTFDVSPPTQSVAQGGNGMLTFTVNRLNGFTAPVTVSLSGAAPGITFPAGTFPLTIPSGGTTGATSFTVEPTASAGGRTLSFNATGGGLSKTDTAQVNVTAGPDFNLTATPDQRTLRQGETTSVSVGVTGLNGLNAPVSVTPPSLVGITFTPAMHSIPPGSSRVFQLTASPSAPLGTRSGEFVGTTAGVPGTRTTPFRVTVDAGPDFTLLIDPPSLELEPGSSARLMLSARGRNGFTDQVTVRLQASGPLQVQPAQVQLPADGAPQPVDVTALANAAEGTFGITLFATAPGVPGTKTSTVPVTVTPPTPRITGVQPPGLASGTVATRVLLTGENFAPGAQVVSQSPRFIRVERWQVLSSSLIEAFVTAVGDTPQNRYRLDVRNPSGRQTPNGAQLLVVPAGSLSAPLGVTTAAIVYPRPWTFLSTDSRIFPRALLATTGLGTIVGSWRLDGVRFDTFVASARGRLPVEITTSIPIPTNWIGEHRLELVVETPQELQVDVPILFTAVSHSALRLLAPSEGQVLGNPAPALRWTLVPGAAGYQVELSDGRQGAPRATYRTNETRFEPSGRAMQGLVRRIGAGERFVRVLPIFPGDVHGQPTPWRRIFVLPEKVELVPLAAEIDPDSGRRRLRWQGGSPGVLYRVELFSGEDRVFSALTFREAYTLPAALTRDDALTSWRVSGLGPGGDALGDSVSAELSPTGRGPWTESHRLVVPAQGGARLVARGPDEGEIVTTTTPRIQVEWEGTVAAEDVTLMLDRSDVTAVAEVGPSSVTYDPLLPLEPGEHTVRLFLGATTEPATWAFVVEVTTGAEAVPEEVPATPSAESGEEPAARAGREPLVRDWAFNVGGTFSAIDADAGDPPATARLQVSTQGTLDENAASQWTADLSVRQDLEGEQDFEEESRNWLGGITARQQSTAEELQIGYANPTFLDRSEYLMAGFAKGGAQGTLHGPAGSLSYYGTLDSELAGVVGGDLGLDQDVQAAGWESPLFDQRFRLRALFLNVDEEEGRYSAGGEGKAYGVMGFFDVNPGLSLVVEGAYGEFDPRAGSFESASDGFGLRLGLTGVRGTFNYGVNLRSTDEGFVNPANRGFTPGGAGDRQGGDFMLSKQLGRVFLSGQYRYLQGGGSGGGSIPETTEQGANLMLSTPLGSKVFLSVSADRTEQDGDGDAELGLPATDRAQSSYSLNLSETFGALSFSQTLVRQELRDDVQTAFDTDTTSATLAANGAFSPIFQLSATVSGIRSEGSELVGRTDQLVFSLQPSFAVPKARLSITPLASYTESESSLFGGKTRTDLYQLLVQWSPGLLRGLVSIQASADAARTRTAFDIEDPDFITNVTLNLILGWGASRQAGQPPGRPPTPVMGGGPSL